MRFNLAKDKDLEKKVLEYLNKQDWPVTTEMVAKELNVSWNTAQTQLWKLAAARRVKTKRVGRQNQWIIFKK